MADGNGPLLGVGCEETTLTSGTGTLSLAGATSGKRKFTDAFVSGEQCFYVIVDGASWEYGLGTLTDATPDTLTRDVVLGSSAGGAKLSLSTSSKLVYSEILPVCAANNGTQTFPDGDTGPSVLGGHVFVVSNTAATTITDFVDEFPGQEIVLFFTNGNTTIADNAVIKNPGIGDITPTANDVASYLKVGAVWAFVAGSAN